MILQHLTVRLPTPLRAHLRRPAAAERRSAWNLAQLLIVDSLAARGAPRIRPRHRDRPQARA
jgi:hypothetical protein